MNGREIEAHFREQLEIAEAKLVEVVVLGLGRCGYEL